MTATTEVQFIVGQSQQLINVDWNWFFSSLAQSVAAIVGFIGAFIFTKIIDSQSEFKRILNNVNEQLALSRKLEGQTQDRCFTWYNKILRKEGLTVIETRIKTTVEKGTEPLSAEEYYFKEKFSIFDCKDKVIEAINKLLSDEAINKLKLISEEKRKVYGWGLRESFLNDFGPIVDKKDLYNDLTEEREKINQLICEIKSQTQLNASLLSDVELNPQYSPFINWGLLCISFLFYLGVIIPLGSLPVINGSPDISFYPKGSQGIFLWPIAIIFVFIMIVIFIINQGCRFKKGASKGVDKLREFINFENYSPYFKNMIKNEAEREKYFKSHACQEALEMPDEE